MDLRNVTGLILSAELGAFDAEQNALRSAKMVHSLLAVAKFDAAVIPLNGSWEGKEEHSYLVAPMKTVINDPVKYQDFLYSIIAIASEFSQAAVLSMYEGTVHLIEIPSVAWNLSREDRIAALKEIMLEDGGRTLLSDSMEIRKVDEDYAKLYEGYTELDGVYYVVS